MRYFTSLVTARPVQAGTLSLIFEPCQPMGGSWLGVLALDEPDASILAANLPGSVSEISQEKYDGLKKKRNPTQPDSNRSQPRPPLTALQASAVLAVPPTRSETGKTDAAAPDVRPLVSVTLRTTREQPPYEPLLDVVSAPKKRRAA